MRESLSEIDRVSAGEVVYPPGGRLGPRRQRDVQLVLLHEGSARIAVDGEERAVLEPGWTALLLPGHREAFAFDDTHATRHSWVQVGCEAGGAPGPIAGEEIQVGYETRGGSGPIAGEEVQVGYETRGGHGPVTRGGAQVGSGAGVGQGLIARQRAVRPGFTELPEALLTSPELAALVAQAVAVARAPRGPLLDALALAALWRYAADAESPPAGLVARARAVIHEQLGDPGLDLDRLARAVHVSSAHLVRRFRAEVGTTPMAYLWDRRVAVAVDLLQSTGLSIKEVAARTGFRSVYHFSRRVKAQAGVPPTGLRARAAQPPGGPSPRRRGA